MARVLLAHPLLLAERPEEQAAASPYFPLGVLYLAAWVRDRGHDVRVYDGTFEPDRSSFVDALADFEPDVVGLSCLLPIRDAALDFATVAAGAGAFVVAGGPDATAEPTRYLAGDVDAVVRHEGEQTFAAVLDAADRGRLTSEGLTRVTGLALLIDGDLVETGRREPIANLDTLPEPARDLIDMNRYLDAWETTAGYRSLTVSVSRGCARPGCPHCADSVHGTGYRERTPADVVAELVSLRDEYTVDRLRLVDDVDAMNRSWFDELAAEAERADLDLRFEALSDLTRTDLPLLDVQDTL
ncbi:MAG: cobalamin-dependent protein [Actinomycetota bacterium]